MLNQSKAMEELRKKAYKEERERIYKEFYAFLEKQNEPVKQFTVMVDKWCKDEEIVIIQKDKKYDQIHVYTENDDENKAVSEAMTIKKTSDRLNSWWAKVIREVIMPEEKY